MEKQRKNLLDYVFPKPKLKEESWVWAVLKVALLLLVLPIVVAYAIGGIHDGLATWFN